MERIDNNGKWIMQDGVELLVEPTQEWIDNNQHEKTLDEILREVRILRNQLLLESDWTQLSDSPLTDDQKEAWKIYRQQLRDFPETITTLEFEFPQKP